jgi:hypothetical protein
LAKWTPTLMLWTPTLPEGELMYALLFIVAFALLLGLAQALGWTVDSREPNGWRPTDAQPPEHSDPAPPRPTLVSRTASDQDHPIAA